MKRQLKILALTLVAFGCLFGGLQSVKALDTAVVGRPYYYEPYGYGNYGPYAPLAYSGYSNPNPALQRGSFASGPFFLGRQIQRNTGINTSVGLNKAGFLFYAPVPGGVLGY